MMCNRIIIFVNTNSSLPIQDFVQIKVEGGHKMKVKAPGNFLVINFKLFLWVFLLGFLSDSCVMQVKDV